jgi:SAM-dependent methyltransferase
MILAVARERYRAVTNLSFVLGDAATMELEAAAFDLIVSRFGVMFFADPVAAFANLRTALAGNGRLSFICWRALDENPWMAECVRAAFTVLPRPEPQPPNAPGPYAFADAAWLRDVLARSGFIDIRIDAVDQALDLGSIDSTVEQMTRMGPAANAFATASAADQQAVITAMRAALKPHLSGGSLRLASATWLVGARRS